MERSAEHSDRVVHHSKWRDIAISVMEEVLKIFTYYTIMQAEKISIEWI